MDEPHDADATALASACHWVQTVQGFTSNPDMLIEPARAVARLCALARTAESTLPFDTDPSVFLVRLDALAKHQGDDA